MIRMVITIDLVAPGAAGVDVRTGLVDAKEEAPEVGATWVGICTAINDYMRKHGSPGFDCLKCE